METLELAQEKREHHDTGNDRELRRLKRDRAKIEPTARAINFVANKSGLE